ncbi:hypothetical protein PIB30_037147 [Stylosanthes scabra]|uniref:Aminotransferase-like plant mobile domain-containing protein n=1 Tax=Stylosanthes scabra TaxID=79078 RepID=A0ABU6REC5_9FABA|nr:hypothetical protein [Stylosanthes scabra]
MARTKQTRNHTAREVPPPLPCLSNNAEEDWFEEDSEKKAYSKRLSRMHIIPPRYVGDGAIPEDKYPEFWRLIDVQGLHQFLLQREGYYPRFVAAAFASVVVDDNLGDERLDPFFFCVSFMGRTFKFPLARIVEAIIGEVSCQQDDYYPPSPVVRDIAHIDAAEEQSRLRYRGRFILLWVMINEKQINWPYLMAHKLVEYSHGKVNSALGLPHLWGKVFTLIPLDVSQEEFVASKPEFAITSKNINQMQRDLANPDGAEEDAPERNVRPRTDVGSSSQVPRETGESSQGQPNFMEMMLKSFEALQARVDEGFAKITDRIDSIDISLISQAEEMRMLRDRFLELVGEVPPTTEPTAEVPTETAHAAEVPSTDPHVTDEATRADDPVAEGGTKVAPVVANQGEGVPAATGTTEVVQEQPVEAPVQD